MSLPCPLIVSDNARPPRPRLRPSGQADGPRQQVAAGAGASAGRRRSVFGPTLTLYTVPLNTLWIKEVGCHSLLPVASIHARFGRTVRALRAKAGYSQESFADAIHIHRTSMGTLERGDGNPRLETILKIARGLGLSLSELFLAVEKDVGL